MPTATELPIDTTATAMEMAQEIFGSGVTVVGATYFGDDLSSGIYTDGDAVAPGVTPGDTGVILSTGHAEDFTNSDGTLNTNQNTNTGTNTDGVNNDAQFNALAGGNATNDASILEIDFMSVGDTLTLDFVISSEEYPEYINSQFLDVVGVWVNGVEAQVSIGNGTASVGNINGANTPNLYQDNTGDQFNTEMDGFTITLTFTAPVSTTGVNTLRVGVADVSDSAFDSNLLLAGGAVQSSIVALDDSIDLGHNDTHTLDVLSNDSSTNPGALTVTHINGVAVVAGDSVTLGTGQTITLNADGTFEVEGDDDAETVYFNYSIEDASGATDTAIVEINQVPCFVAGTWIETQHGKRRIEDIKTGDLIMTRDGGLKPLRWIGHRTVAAKGCYRPVRLRKGTFGAKEDLLLSPQHRVMIAHYWAELLFGSDEVLVKAKALLNDSTITLAHDIEEVTYFHMLFDEHHVITANGVPCESYLPGPATSNQFDADTQAEIVSLFPELSGSFENYGPAARTILKTREVTALLTALAA